MTDLINVIHRVAKPDNLRIRDRRLFARQCLELFVLQRALHGAQPIGPFGMPLRRHMVEASGMGEVQGGHAMF